MRGLGDDRYITWVDAAAGLLGVILPISIAAVLIIFSHSGVTALKDRTRELLVEVLPSALRFLPEFTVDFAEAGPDFKPQEQVLEPRIMMRHRPGSCVCEYKILVPDIPAWGSQGAAETWRQIFVRVELNVEKANCIVCFPRDLIEQRLDDEPDGSAAEIDIADAGARLVQRAFRHTLDGAAAEGYQHLERLLNAEMEGRKYLCLVLVRPLPEDFLLDPRKKLGFCQDFMFMMRGFHLEQPDIFERL